MKKWLSIYSITWLLLVLYSFTRLDLNLTFYFHPYLEPLKNSLSYLGYYQRSLATLIFISLVIAIYLAYFQLISTKQKSLSKAKRLIPFAIKLLGLGVIAYPMFSHDIFNYLFNAKMVLVYHANPHLQTAIEFGQDAWTRFMHNVHSPAPYGYAWTAISLAPIFFTLPNFTLSFWATKLLIAIFFILEIYIFYLLSKKIDKKNALSKTFMLALNPLIITETLINGHNDSLMIFFALLSFYFLEKKTHLKHKILALLSYTFSVLIKYATVVLAPFLLFKDKIKNVYGLSGVLMILILLSRPGQLNSWYLHWGLAFLFLSPKKIYNQLGILLSIGGLLRYAPYIYYGNWDYPVTIYRWIILLAPLLYLIKPRKHALKN